jgi:hypothetical protein
MSEIDDDLDELPTPPRKSIPEADRQLLELAARAIGAVRFEEVEGEGYANLHFADGLIAHNWNPLQFSDDAFNLAVDLGMQVVPAARTVNGQACAAVASPAGARLAEETSTPDARAATRRAIVRAAAEIGKTT